MMSDGVQGERRPMRREHCAGRSILRVPRGFCVLALGLGGLAGCVVGPDHVPPTPDLPAAFDGAPASAAAPAPAPADSGADADADAGQPGPGLEQWWKLFGDAQLDALVDEALASNLDLQAAGQRVLRARALVTVAGGPGLPQVDARAGGTRSRVSSNAFDDPGTNGGGGTAFRAPGETSSLYHTGFDAVWELDLFGGVQRGVEAAAAEHEAATYEQRDVLVSLLAELCGAYVDLRSAQRRLDIAEHNLAAQADTAALTAERERAGLGSSFEAARAEAQLTDTRAALDALTSAVAAAGHRIDVLLARPAGTTLPQLGAATPAVPVAPSVPIGLPADLLWRRPDLRSAERSLAAETARIGVAMAARFPRLSLTGSAGLQSRDLGDLLHRSSRDGSLGLGLSVPLFDGGTRRAEVSAQEALAAEAALAYEQRVLVALQEVADALVSTSQEQQRREHLAASVAARQRALDAAESLQSAGMWDFLAVLDGQRDLFAAEDTLAVSEQALARDVVALYKALGGGWDAQAPQAAGDAPSASGPTDTGAAAAGHQAPGEPAGPSAAPDA